MLSKILLTTLGISFGIFTLLATTFSLKWIILLSSVLAMLVALTIFPSMKRLLLTLMIVDMDLLINKHFFHNPDVIASSEGLQVSITTITLILLYILLWMDMATKRARRIEFFPKTTVIAIGYLFSCLLSMYNSPNLLMSIFDIFFRTQMIMVYFYIANYITSKVDMIYIARILLICLFIQSTILLMQNITGTKFNLVGKTSSVDVLEYSHRGRSMAFSRPVGTGGSPNETGGHIAILLLVTLSLLLYTKSRFENTLVWIVLLMGMAALILTFSRGSWVGFAVGLVVFLFVALRHHWMSWKKVITVAILIVMILGVFSVPMAARLSQDDRGAAWARVPLMKLAFNMIQEHPFIGIGVNNFSIELPRYLSSELRGEWLYIVHNQYLLVFAETGLIGLFFFLSIIAIVMQTCLRCIKHNDPLISPLSTGILSGIIALSIFMTVELSISRLTVQLFWIMASIVMASERLIRMNRKQFLNLSSPMKVGNL
jgi:O-antigen ligase